MGDFVYVLENHWSDVRELNCVPRLSLLIRDSKELTYVNCSSKTDIVIQFKFCFDIRDWNVVSHFNTRRYPYCTSRWMQRMNHPEVNKLINTEVYEYAFLNTLMLVYRLKTFLFFHCCTEIVQWKLLLKTKRFNKVCHRVLFLYIQNPQLLL